MLLIDRKMPKSCGDCVCNNDNFLCNITYDEFDGDMWERRMPNCPLKEEERKTGKWVCSDDLYETAICSCCGWDTTEPWDHIRNWFMYCPHCGAKMEGEQP